MSRQIPRTETIEALLVRMRRVTDTYTRKDGKPWGLDKQLLKIYEEVGEVHELLKKGSRSYDPLLFEIVDVIFSAFTMAHLLHYPDSDISFYMDRKLQIIEDRAKEYEAKEKEEESR